MSGSDPKDLSEAEARADTPLSGGETPSTGKSAYILLLAFTSGAASMMIELTAVRLLAPYFGQSVYAWTNIIGVILAALALGYYVGGRLADGRPSLRVLCLVLVAAALATAVLPLASRPLAEAFVSPDFLLEEAFAVLVRGSFVCTILLFGPPVLLLGMVGPFATRLITAQRSRVGRGTGVVYGVSTAGSLVGTFLPAHFLIPTVGSRLTILSAAAGLLVVALPTLCLPRNHHTKALLVLLVVPVLSAWWIQGTPTKGASGQVLFEKDSPYQFVQVVRTGSRVELKLNEGLDSFHSVLVEGSLSTGGLYYDYLLLAPLLLRPDDPIDAAILGFACGTSSRQLHGYFGDRLARVEGVEIDPVTVTAGRLFLDLDRDRQPKLRIHDHLDGRIFLDHVDTVYNVLLVDAYTSQIYVPFHLASREFFVAARRRLSPDGVLALNVGTLEARADPLADPLVSAMANTITSVFHEVRLVPVPNSRNVILLAGRTADLLRPDLLEERVPHPDLERLLAQLPRSVRTIHHDPDGPVWTDDRNPVEKLMDRNLFRRSRDILDGLP